MEKSDDVESFQLAGPEAGGRGATLGWGATLAKLSPSDSPALAVHGMEAFGNSCLRWPAVKSAFCWTLFSRLQSHPDAVYRMGFSGGLLLT